MLSDLSTRVPLIVALPGQKEGLETHALVELVDLSGRRRMIDVGGGPGTYSALLAGRYPDLHSRVLDLPGVLEIAREIIASMGVADRNRVGIGGHSYGAFMTANLLAHSNLFKAGIARSGAYNRTLTPFGFQNERRTFWEAPQTYFAMSPFMHANKIDEPILLLHGERENNSGTFPIQSKRLYHAIKGHGGSARLVMLPFESHGYRARESVLHVLAESLDWLNRHVKGGDAEAF